MGGSLIPERISNCWVAAKSIADCEMRVFWKPLDVHGNTERSKFIYDKPTRNADSGMSRERIEWKEIFGTPRSDQYFSA
jgi:hypothetical protein